MIKFGPYGKNHATAGTFAFKKELLKQTSYDEEACIAEEKHFLKDYTIPFVQLDPMKTILVFSHIHNTFDKRKLLENPNDSFMNVSYYSVDDFIKEEDIKQFFIKDIDSALETYSPGLPKFKPDVLKQIKEITEKREQERNNYSKQQQRIVVQMQDGKNTVLDINDVAKLLKHQNELILKLQKDVQEKDSMIAKLKQEVERFQINKKSIELMENPVVPVDISYGMFLEISENDILAQINNIN